MGVEDENCAYGEVITSKTECIKASKMLGLSFQRERSSADYPAGCHYVTFSQQSYFNQILDIAATSPKYFLSNAGVCHKEGNQCY